VCVGLSAFYLLVSLNNSCSLLAGLGGVYFTGLLLGSISQWEREAKRNKNKAGKKKPHKMDGTAFFSDTECT